MKAVAVEEGTYAGSGGLRSRFVDDRFVLGFVILIGSEDERED